MSYNHIGNNIVTAVGIFTFGVAIFSPQFPNYYLQTISSTIGSVVASNVEAGSLSRAIQGTVQDVWFAINYPNKQFQGTI